MERKTPTAYGRIGPNQLRILHATSSLSLSAFAGGLGVTTRRLDTALMFGMELHPQAVDFIAGLVAQNFQTMQDLYHWQGSL